VSDLETLLPTHTPQQPHISTWHGMTRVLTKISFCLIDKNLSVRGFSDGVSFKVKYEGGTTVAAGVCTQPTHLSCSRGLHPTNPPQLQQGFAPNQPTSDADFIILPTFLRNFQYNFPDIFKTFSRHLSDFFQVPNISVWPTQIKHKH